MEKVNGRFRIRIPCPDGIVGCAVCHYVWVGEEAYDQIHDCYYDYYRQKPNPSSIAQIHKLLPNDIHLLANQWGWNDTEVGDKIYRWLRDNNRAAKVNI